MHLNQVTGFASYLTVATVHLAGYRTLARTTLLADNFAMSLKGEADIRAVDRATRESDQEAERIKAASRQRAAALAAEGNGLQALSSSLKLMGIDADDIYRGGERPKLIDFELT
jgi:hypothetical protein